MSLDRIGKIDPRIGVRVSLDRIGKIDPLNPGLTNVWPRVSVFGHFAHIKKPTNYKMFWRTI